MSKLTAVAAALLVVLAGYGIAGAATVTLSIQIADNQLEIGENTTYTVYASVSGNTTDDTYGFVLNGGVASFMIDQVYSGAGDIKHYPVQPPPPTNATSKNANTTIQSPYTALVTKGTVMTEAWVADRNGTGGVDNTQGAQALPADKFIYYTDAAPYQLGNGTPVALFTGRIDAVANGAVTINVAGQAGQVLVWKLNANGLYTAVADVVGGQAALNVGSVVVKPNITSGNVSEGAWSDEPGWNNPAHSVNVTSDAVGACVWKISDGTTNWTLAATTPSFILTIGAIAASGATLPPPYMGGDHSADPLYNWHLTVTAGGQTSDPVTVFVPEPATIGLLGFGIVGALIRRRRA